MLLYIAVINIRLVATD